MRSLAIGLAAVCFTAGAAMAQTGANTGTGTGTGAGSSTGTVRAPNVSTGLTGTAVPGVTKTGPSGQAAASGDNNQAVATTNTNAPQPARGSTSFTAEQARTRMEKQGFAGVTDLKKDDGGIWRGKAQKNGQTVNVWLDYKGNVGGQ